MSWSDSTRARFSQPSPEITKQTSCGYDVDAPNSVEKRRFFLEADHLTRISILGRPGSGKSNFSKLLAARLKIRVYHLDREYFEANWVRRPQEEFLESLSRIVGEESWIADGNFISSLETRYARSDAVLYFNRSRALCYWRVLKRRLSFGSDASDRPDDCPEDLRWVLFKYMWGYRRVVDTHLRELQSKYPEVRLIEITTAARECAAFEFLTRLHGEMNEPRRQ